VYVISKGRGGKERKGRFVPRWSITSQKLPSFGPSRTAGKKKKKEGGGCESAFDTRSGFCGSRACAATSEKKKKKKRKDGEKRGERGREKGISMRWATFRSEMSWIFLPGIGRRKKEEEETRGREPAIAPSRYCPTAVAFDGGGGEGKGTNE